MSRERKIKQKKTKIVHFGNQFAKKMYANNRFTETLIVAE